MADERWTNVEIRCALLWRLARSHGWANWIPENDLIRAVPSHERGRARVVVEELRRTPLVRSHRDRGYKLAHDGIDALARELRNVCDFDAFRIEATLSHFGGFG